MLESTMFFLGLASIGASIAILLYLLANKEISERPTRGHRGLKRSRALLENATFRLCEPIIRYLARWISQMPLSSTRTYIEALLLRGGDYMGLTADELIGLCVLSACVCVGVASCAVATNIVAPWVIAAALLLGAYAPFSRLQSETKIRLKSITRELPSAIDLASLCMGAGLDFVGALRQILAHGARSKRPIYEELGRLVQELELGHTRRQALTGFAERAPSDAVRDFVNAVVQSEEKGNPLAEVLRVQASMLRLRRSIAAEESAAKAGVMMMAPLMMIFAAIMLIILGPFVINNMQKGF